MERKLAGPKGTSRQWIAADEHDMNVSDMESAGGVLDWDPWWPVTAKPRGGVANSERDRAPATPPTNEDNALRLEALNHRRDAAENLTVERAILKVEGMLISATSTSRQMRRESILGALNALAAALRTPRSHLEELVYDVGSTSAWSSLLQTERHFGQLADRVEDLAMRLESGSPVESRPPIREVVRRAKGLLAEETGAMVDIYWLDAGVVD